MKKTIISIIVAIIVMIIVFTINTINRNKTIDKLTTYAEKQFSSDFEEYISELNVTDISVSGTFEFSDTSYNQKENKLSITCYVKYTSDNILNYFTDDYNSSDARKLCDLLKSIYQIVKENRFLRYEYDNIGIVSIEIKGDNSYYGIIISDSNNNKYKYDKVVSYDNVLINDDYIFMESDGSFESSSNSNTSSKGTEVTDDDERNICWSLARDVVEAQLKSPSSAKFPFSYADKDVSITKSGDTYTVKSWVDAENSFGAKLRSDFTVTITKSGTKFTAESCVIDE